MPYTLKKGIESFEIMGGPDEGKQFFREKVYDAVPEGYADRFECVDPASCPPRGQVQEAKKPEKKTPIEAPEPVSVPTFLQKQTDNKETV